MTKSHAHKWQIETRMTLDMPSNMGKCTVRGCGLEKRFTNEHRPEKIEPQSHEEIRAMLQDSLDRNPTIDYSLIRNGGWKLG